MRFLTSFCNCLSIRGLSQRCFARRFGNNFQRCETCLTEARNMAFCGAKHARSRLDTCPGATRNMPNVEIRFRCLKQNLANTGFSSSISHKKCARFFSEQSQQSNGTHQQFHLDSPPILPRRPFAGEIQTRGRGWPDERHVADDTRRDRPHHVSFPSMGEQGDLFAHESRHSLADKRQMALWPHARSFGLAKTM